MSDAPSKSPARAGVSDDTLPTLEFRVAISPTAQDMRMLRYLLQTIQTFGGPIARAARTVALVGSNEEPRDLHAEYPWAKHFGLDFRWTDRELYAEWTDDAAGFDRFCVQSNADVVAMIEVNLICGRDLDEVIMKAHLEQTMLGSIGHTSPFAFAATAPTPSNMWWKRIFDNAGVDMPELRFEYSAWNLNWDAINPNAKLVSGSADHRYGPAYFNDGFIVGPRRFFDAMGADYVDDVRRLDQVLDKPYKKQIANPVSFARHGVPCETIPLNFNYPLNLCKPGTLPDSIIRALNPDPDGQDHPQDIRMFHYIGHRKLFGGRRRVNQLLERTDLTGAWRVFQERVRSADTKISARR